MPNFYVTLGQIHAHNVDGKTFDKDCVAVIEADSWDHAREIAFTKFGQQWCFLYSPESWDEKEQMKYYPRGYIEL